MICFTKRKEISWLWLFMILGGSFGCQPNKSYIPLAKNGEMDLSQWDFERQEIVQLDGDWLFHPHVLDLEGISEKDPDDGYLMNVPGDWDQPLYQGSEDDQPVQFGIYQLLIRLPKQRPQLAIRLQDVPTAYRLTINGKYVGAIGEIATTFDEATPQYSPAIYPLSGQDSVLLTLQVSNFHHFKGGLLISPLLGVHKALTYQNTTSSIFSGILQGLCLLNAFFFMALFIYRKKPTYYLYFSLSNITLFVNLLCLNNRWLYDFLGMEWWGLTLKIELGAIILFFMFRSLFFPNLYDGIIHPIAVKIGTWIFSVQFIFLLLLPAPVFSAYILTVPFNLFVLIPFFLYLFIRAIKHDRPGATAILVISLLYIGVIVRNNFFIDSYVSSVVPIYIAIILDLIVTAVILGKTLSNAMEKEEKLTGELEQANETLEKQNRNLEGIVEERTAQLLDVEKETHRLQMEKKEKDLNMVSAANLMKMQHTQNLIHELEALQSSSSKELPNALRSLVLGLRSQYATEEKLHVLQEDMDRVNSEFYERIKDRFPQLTRSERELCAFIKLNLSNQDIADLRNTSLNTVHVLRSRLRKKLNLSPDEDMELLLQQL